MEYSPRQIRDETRRFFQKVYFWMFIGLMISGITAFIVASNPAYYKLILGNKAIFFSLLMGEIILVFALALLIKKIHAYLGFFMFFLYCFMTGLTLSSIFLIYTLGSIATTFYICAGMFGIMSVYGFFTKKDLTGIGQVLIMALFGMIIAMIVNIFLRNSMFDIIISIIGVIIFTGLTAYDTQKIRKKNIIGNEGTQEDLKESIMGALTLYLDFVNLFLHLLRLLGKRR